VKPKKGGLDEPESVLLVVCADHTVVIKGSDVWQPTWEPVAGAANVFAAVFEIDRFPTGEITWLTAPANNPKSDSAFDPEKDTGGGVDNRRIGVDRQQHYCGHTSRPSHARPSRPVSEHSGGDLPRGTAAWAHGWTSTPGGR